MRKNSTEHLLYRLKKGKRYQEALNAAVVGAIVNDEDYEVWLIADATRLQIPLKFGLPLRGDLLAALRKHPAYTIHETSTLESRGEMLDRVGGTSLRVALRRVSVKEANEIVDARAKREKRNES